MPEQNPGTGLVNRYEEVYNRPELQGQNNRGALLWDSTGRSSDSAGQSAYNAFQDIMGRAPSEIELNQFLPVFQGSYEQGRGAVANFAQMESQKPQNLAKNAPQYHDQVNQVFKSMLGRDASSDELSHFGGMIASGNLDAYQLQNFLTGTPEYQGAQDKTFRSGLEGELQGYDQKFFDKSKQGLIAQGAQNGQTLGNSSALDSALVDLMGQIADKRGQYLANLSSQQYGGNKDLAIGNYKSTMDQYLGDQQTQRNQTFNAFNGNVNRANDMYDYAKQMNDYNQSQQGRNVLHPNDWMNVGLNLVNTGAQAYGASMGKPPSGGGGGFQPYQPGGSQGPYNYGYLN